MKVYLAPMEGITGYIYRNTYEKFFGQIDRYFTPFIASKKLNSKEKKDILPENNMGIDVVPQILTNKADEFISIAKQLEQQGYGVVNLNLGCPSGTVVAKNRGAGFFAVPDKLQSFLDEIFRDCPLSISIKTRIGLTSPDEMESIINMYNDYPLEELIIHPRTQTDYYKNPPHIDKFIEAVQISRHSICYNGEINSVKDYENIANKCPGLDKIMLGRGLLANPGLAGEIKGEAPINYAQYRLFHNELYKKYKESMLGETNTLYKMKELWIYMGRFFPDTERILKEIRKAESFMEYDIAVNRIFR